MILANFLSLGILLVLRDRLKMSVITLIACKTKCFGYIHEMSSGPVEVFFVLRLACCFMSGEGL